MSAALIGTFVILWIIVISLSFLLLGALRALARLGWRLDELEATTPSRIGRSGLHPGTKAPEFTLKATDGSEASLLDFAGRQLLLVFTQPDCPPCHSVVPELNKLRTKGNVDIVAICNGDAAAVRQWAAETGARFRVLEQQHWRVSRRYEVFATPFAFLVDGDGIIKAKGILSNAEHIRFLLGGSGDGARMARAESASSPAGMTQMVGTS